MCGFIKLSGDGGEKDCEQRERYQRVMQLIPTPIGICYLTEKAVLSGRCVIVYQCLFAEVKLPA